MLFPFMKECGEGYISWRVIWCSFLLSRRMQMQVKMCIRDSNSTLASFDITNLYTNVPIKETIQTLEQLLRQNNTPETHIQEIITLTKLITEQNYFTYNNKTYTQTEGLPMGSPISGILAEIYIHNIEQNHIINNNKYTNKIIYWHRYVDDILLLFKGNTRQVENFHKYINTCLLYTSRCV